MAFYNSDTRDPSLVEFESLLKRLSEGSGCVLRVVSMRCATVTLPSEEMVIVSFGTSSLLILAARPYLGWLFPRKLATLDVRARLLDQNEIMQAVAAMFAVQAGVIFATSFKSVAAIRRSSDSNKLLSSLFEQLFKQWALKSAGL